MADRGSDDKSTKGNYLFIIIIHFNCCVRWGWADQDDEDSVVDVVVGGWRVVGFGYFVIWEVVWDCYYCNIFTMKCNSATLELEGRGWNIHKHIMHCSCQRCVRIVVLYYCSLLLLFTGAERGNGYLFLHNNNPKVLTWLVWQNMGNDFYAVCLLIVPSIPLL